jgi:transposase
MSARNPRRTPYPPEFRARAVELARTSGLTPRQVAEDLGVDPDSVRRWLRQADIDTGQRPGLATDERAELARLRRENALLREEREILKKAAVFFAHESATR